MLLHGTIVWCVLGEKYLNKFISLIQYSEFRIRFTAQFDECTKVC